MREDHMKLGTTGNHAIKENETGLSLGPDGLLIQTIPKFRIKQETLSQNI